MINESLGRLRRHGAQVIPLDAAMEWSEHQTEAWMEDDPDQRSDRAAMRSEVRRLMEARIDTLPDAFRTALVALALFLAAAGGGAILNLNYHWKQLPLPKWLVVTRRRCGAWFRIAGGDDLGGTGVT